MKGGVKWGGSGNANWTCHSAQLSVIVLLYVYKSICTFVLVLRKRELDLPLSSAVSICTFVRVKHRRLRSGVPSKTPAHIGGGGGRWCFAERSARIYALVFCGAERLCA